jgi:hypothetical protein
MFEKILFASSGNQPLYGGAGVLSYCPSPQAVRAISPE